ncbi:MAG: hypothetical protein HZC12_07645 [Nitrospirae bacterium]|nr:hypothetical protein [Nitrospirota bacterium]
MCWAEGLSDINIQALNEKKTLHWGRDPFVREIDGKGPEREGIALPARVRLNGIISNGQKSVAIINGNFLRKGDMIDGLLLTDIMRDRVIFDRKGAKTELTIEKFVYEGSPKKEEKKEEKPDEN